MPIKQPTVRARLATGHLLRHGASATVGPKMTPLYSAQADVHSAHCRYG